MLQFRRVGPSEHEVNVFQQKWTLRMAQPFCNRFYVPKPKLYVYEISLLGRRRGVSLRGCCSCGVLPLGALRALAWRQSLSGGRHEWTWSISAAWDRDLSSSSTSPGTAATSSAFALISPPAPTEVNILFISPFSSFQSPRHCQRTSKKQFSNDVLATALL